jgi:SAM-dependent methyltransferase
LGAGAGFYTLALLEKGYSVTAVEPRQVNLSELKRQALQLPKSKQDQLKAIQDDHTWLIEAPHQFDGILLMGPLYHLFDDQERAKLLALAYEKLKPKGKLLCTWLSRMGWLAHVFARQNELIKKDPAQIEQILLTGEIPHHPKDGSFRGKFDSLSSVQSLFLAAKVPMNELTAIDPIGSFFDDQFRALPDQSQKAWAEALLLSAHLPESLGAAKTWLTCSEKP